MLSTLLFCILQLAVQLVKVQEESRFVEAIYKTYNSLCELRAAVCKQKQAIIFLKKGACEAEKKRGDDMKTIEGDLFFVSSDAKSQNEHEEF